MSNAPTVIGTNIVVGFGNYLMTNMTLTGVPTRRGAAVKDIEDENANVMTHLITGHYKECELKGKILVANGGLAFIEALNVGSILNVNSVNMMIHKEIVIERSPLEAICTIPVKKPDSMTY
jgi:hypothetical protein